MVLFILSVVRCIVISNSFCCFVPPCLLVLSGPDLLCSLSYLPVLSCLVLSGLLLPRLDLSCFLSCIVLCHLERASLCLVLSCLGVLSSYLVPSCPVLSCLLFLSCPVSTSCFLSCLVLFFPLHVLSCVEFLSSCVDFFKVVVSCL